MARARRRAGGRRDVRASVSRAGGPGGARPASGVVGAIAEPLFRTYLVPFEITSILLLAAAVGAVVLAKRKL